MALSSTEHSDTPYDSYSRSNGVQSFAISGASGAGGTVTVKDAVASSQIYFKGQLRASGATTLTFKTADGGTAVGVYEYQAAGTKRILVGRCEAGELLQLHSSADVTVQGTIYTLPVVAGMMVPPEWSLNW